MAQSAVTVRLDSKMKSHFDKLCAEFGMSVNTAINIFVNAVVRSRSIIDTNVLVSALITHNPEAATAKVVRLLLEQGFIPIYDADIIAGYEDVLHRKKLPILPEVADAQLGK